MTVTMVKKRLADGSVCKKCIEAEALLKRRGAWGFIDAVVWAVEDDPKSEGMRLANALCRFVELSNARARGAKSH